MALIDHDILGYVARLRRGVTVDEETLAESVVRDVGIGGEFLSHAHTLEHFRSELYQPTLLWRGKRPLWAADGGRDLEARAEEAAQALVAEAGEPYVDDDQDRELGRIAASARSLA